MSYQLEIPKDQQPTPDQEWGFTISEFFMGNLWYIIGIIILVDIFLYARSNMKKH